LLVHLRSGSTSGDVTLLVLPPLHAPPRSPGLLLLNRSVFFGAHIMTDPHDVPEQQFPLCSTAAAGQQEDECLDLQPLQAQLAACSSSRSSAQQLQLLTPGLDQLYTLLQQSSSSSSAGAAKQLQQRQAGGLLDAAAIMQLATRESLCASGSCMLCTASARLVVLRAA
jgi:hypothetical protein